MKEKVNQQSLQPEQFCITTISY